MPLTSANAVEFCTSLCSKQILDLKFKFKSGNELGVIKPKEEESIRIYMNENMGSVAERYSTSI